VEQVKMLSVVLHPEKEEKKKSLPSESEEAKPVPVELLEQGCNLIAMAAEDKHVKNAVLSSEDEKIPLWSTSVKFPSDEFKTVRGSDYVGEVINDSPNGLGYAWNDKCNGCLAFWLGGRVTGYGKYRWPTGDYYIGEMMQGVRHGLGEYHTFTTYEHTILHSASIKDQAKGPFKRETRNGTIELESEGAKFSQNIYSEIFNHGPKRTPFIQTIQLTKRASGYITHSLKLRYRVYQGTMKE